MGKRITKGYGRGDTFYLIKFIPGQNIFSNIIRVSEKIKELTLANKRCLGFFIDLKST